MTTNFELAAPFAPTLPLTLVSTVAATPSLRRARMTNPRPAAKTEVRLELVASLRHRIANGTYRVSAMQVADSMFSAIYSA